MNRTSFFCIPCGNCFSIVCRIKIFLLALVIPGIGTADILAAWDVDGVDVGAGIGVEQTSFPYAMNATTHGVNIFGGQLTLGADLPSAAANLYGFKFSPATHQTTLTGAIANEHYIQFTLVAETGYRFDLLSIEMNGETKSSGPDNIALMSNVDGFSVGNEIDSLAGRQGAKTGGWDTDPSGWGDIIELLDPQYQNLNTVTFRLYGWNSSGTASAGIRDLSGNDLVINGTVEAIPEPAVIGFIALTGLGVLIVRRFTA